MFEDAHPRFRASLSEHRAAIQRVSDHGSVGRLSDRDRSAPSGAWWRLRCQLCGIAFLECGLGGGVAAAPLWDRDDVLGAAFAGSLELYLPAEQFGGLASGEQPDAEPFFLARCRLVLLAACA